MRLALAVLLSAAWTIPCPATGQDARRQATTATPSDNIRVALCQTTGGGLVAETASFRIHWCAPERDVRGLAATCERLAAESKTAWLGAQQLSAWIPQCEIVVHRDTNEYVACLGPRSALTSGCTTIRIDQGHVVLRRIDLCADAFDWQSESLPHELMHVVLADRFSSRRIAPWADEGIAILSETLSKRNRRLAALRGAVASGATYTVRDLMNVRTFPEPALRAAFYGQSAALVSLLLEWGTRQQLLEFVEASQSQGLDAALAVYGNRPPAELERQLADSLATDRFIHLAGASSIATAKKK